DEERRPKADYLADLEAEERAQHVKARVGEIQHAHHAEDQRQAARHQKQQHAVKHAIQGRYSDELQHNRASLVGSARPVHFAAGRQVGVLRGDLAGHLPAPSSALLVERLILANRTQFGDVHRLEELVILGAHETVAAVIDGDFHTVELGRDLDRVERLRFLRRFDEHADLVDGTRIEKGHVGLGAERFLELNSRRIELVRDAFADYVDAIRQVGLLDRRRPASTAGIIGVPVDLQSGIGGGLEQQSEILTPIAGDNAVGAGSLDLGDIG